MPRPMQVDSTIQIEQSRGSRAKNMGLSVIIRLTPAAVVVAVAAVAAALAVRPGLLRVTVALPVACLLADDGPEVS